MHCLLSYQYLLHCGSQLQSLPFPQCTFESVSTYYEVQSAFVKDEWTNKTIRYLRGQAVLNFCRPQFFIFHALDAFVGGTIDWVVLEHILGDSTMRLRLRFPTSILSGRIATWRWEKGVLDCLVIGDGGQEGVS